MPRGADWDIFEAGSKTMALDRKQLTNAYAVAQTSIEFDAYARTYAGHRTLTPDGDGDGRPCRPAAGRHEADRPAGRGRPAD